MKRLAALLLVLPAAGVAAAPVAVNDDAGRRVELPRPAQRIAALAPNLVEQLAAIGVAERIVATSEFANHPPGAERIPRVSRASGVDLERLAALKPDLVVVWGGGTPAGQIAAIERLGLPVYVAEARDLESIASSMERLGTLSAAPGAAAAAAKFRADVAALRVRYAGAAPVRVFFQVWHAPLMTVGGSQVISQAIALCGGRNVFAQLAPLAPTVSTEAVLAADPQIMLTAEPGGAPRADFAAAWRAYPQLAASRANAFVTLDADRLNRAGPRLPGEISKLCAAIEAQRGR